MTRPLSIVVCHRSPSGDTARSPIVDTLESLGHTVRGVRDGPVDLGRHDAVLFWGNANWFPKMRRQLRATPARDRPTVVIWHAEPLPPSRASGLPRLAPLRAEEIWKMLFRRSRASDIYTNRRCLRRLHRAGLPDFLFVANAARDEFLSEHGIACHHLPHGYHPSHGRLLDLERDIDVLFLGDMRIRRRQRAVRRLRAAGIDVEAVGDWADPLCFGESRTRLLNRTRILLNLQRLPGEVAGLRLILGMANGALVISEPIHRPEPYVPGEHYIDCPPEAMPGAIRYHLEHEEERRAIAAAGHRFVTCELTMERSLGEIVRRIRKRETARPSRCAPARAVDEAFARLRPTIA